jgi:hypothetical protein
MKFPLRYENSNKLTFVIADDCELVFSAYDITEAEVSELVRRANAFDELRDALEEAQHLIETPGDFVDDERTTFLHELDDLRAKYAVPGTGSEE